MIKKADIILALILVITGLAASIIVATGYDNVGSKVNVYVDNNLYGTYSLDKDREVTIHNKEHLNKITIKQGKVSMSFSNCKNKDCMKQGEISKQSQSIICLPNKVVVEIEGSSSKNEDYDSISN